METLEKKRCKECGEYFTPRSARQQYCDKLHYRPCPNCGKLVEAKYLSDPPKYCSDECRKEARQNKKQSGHSDIVSMVEFQDEATSSVKAAQRTAEQSISLALFGLVNKDISDVNLEEHEDKLRKKFKCKTYVNEREVLGFKCNHEYAIIINRPKGYVSYEVSAVYDFDEGKMVDLMMPCSSMISINKYFV